MAIVNPNPDGTFAVTLTARETRVLTRWATEGGTAARRLKAIIEDSLQARARMYSETDGPKMRDQYDALTPEKQAQVDALLAGG